MPGVQRRKALFAWSAFAALVIGPLLLSFHSFPRLQAGARSGAAFAPSSSNSSLSWLSLPVFGKQDRKYETELQLEAISSTKPLNKSTTTVPTMLQTLRRCTNLKCIKVAHSRPREPGMFNFPHFYIAGWQKTATTSLYYYLGHHRQINQPVNKEPEFFTNGCMNNIRKGCSEQGTINYIRNTLQLSNYVRHNGTIATYEASTHYSRKGSRIAADLYDTFPWVKIVMSLREPISRAASMLVHKNYSSGEGCLSKPGQNMSSCLVNYSQISGDTSGGPAEYYSVLKTWIDAFPRDQLFIILYENLTSRYQDAELTRLKNFLGLDPSLPDDIDGLELRNARRQRIHPDGWPIRRETYEYLINLVRDDCKAVARFITEHNFGNGNDWLAKWQQAWARNLASCDKNGDCLMKLT